MRVDNIGEVVIIVNSFNNSFYVGFSRQLSKNSLYDNLNDTIIRYQEVINSCLDINDFNKKKFGILAGSGALFNSLGIGSFLRSYIDLPFELKKNNTFLSLYRISSNDVNFDKSNWIYFLTSMGLNIDNKNKKVSNFNIDIIKNFECSDIWSLIKTNLKKDKFLEVSIEEPKIYNNDYNNEFFVGFGKYKDLKWKDLIEKDNNYIKWLISNTVNGKLKKFLISLVN